MCRVVLDIHDCCSLIHFPLGATSLSAQKSFEKPVKCNTSVGICVLLFVFVLRTPNGPTRQSHKKEYEGKTHTALLCSALLGHIVNWLFHCVHWTIVIRNFPSLFRYLSVHCCNSFPTLVNPLHSHATMSSPQEKLPVPWPLDMAPFSLDSHWMFVLFLNLNFNSLCSYIKQDFTFTKTICKFTNTTKDPQRVYGNSYTADSESVISVSLNYASPFFS